MQQLIPQILARAIVSLCRNEWMTQSLGTRGFNHLFKAVFDKRVKSWKILDLTQSPGLAKM